MKTEQRPAHLQHLGGHLNTTHIDEGIIDWAINDLNAKTFLDIGCGPGGMVEYILSKGLFAFGVDGDPLVKRNLNEDNFLLHDFCIGPLKITKQYDIAWSCEFVEHVDEKFIDNYMETFKSAKIVLMTFAPPGTRGHHHVNCQTESYWISMFKKRGFDFDQNFTSIAKNKSTMKRDFFRKNGLVFQNINA